MKKTYSKPVIVFESFQLATSIAGGCALGTKPSVDVGGFQVFADTGCGAMPQEVFTDSNDCNTLPQEGKDDNICYDVPTADSNVFSS